MNPDFLAPVKDSVIAHTLLSPNGVLGNQIVIHSKSNGFPDLNSIQVALIGVEEDRNTEDNLGSGQELHYIRKHLYQLFPGSWKFKIADLGTIQKGNSTADTYFALQQTITSLLKKNIIPVIIGGGQDLTYANYRAYDALEQTVNLTVIDSLFDLGNYEDDLSSKSFLSKILMEKPNNLFNYSNLGYQTYFNSQEEINLINQLNFDAFRLGKAKNLEISEAVLRDADIVSIDIGAVRQSDAPANNNASPNGFYGEELCALARYAGLSDKVTSFGIYEFNANYDRNHQTAHLIAQSIWYFIEGVSFRSKDYPYCSKDSYEKYTVLLENDDPINFYKSDKTGRWWMEINIIHNNKHKRHALIPCTYQDYKEATEQVVPEKWFKAQQKMLY